MWKLARIVALNNQLNFLTPEASNEGERIDTQADIWMILGCSVRPSLPLPLFVSHSSLYIYTQAIHSKTRQGCYQARFRVFRGTALGGSFPGPFEPAQQIPLLGTATFHKSQKGNGAMATLQSTAVSPAHYRINIYGFRAVKNYTTSL